jgi:citrate lyase subunit beta/citryl-CoA lyase
MLEKAMGLSPDQVVVDLEDAVPPAEKNDETRGRVVEALRRDGWLAPTLSVRVNAVASEWFRDDVVRVVQGAAGRLTSLVIPKVESVDTVLEVEELLREVEGEDVTVPVAVEVQIESALGLTRVEEIAGASVRLEALIFGPGDYAASLGIPQHGIGVIDPAYPGDQWHYPRSRIAVAAHANGLDPIDGPYGSFRDQEGLVETARRARLLGFGGKWVIHPDQIEPCNSSFSPSAEEVAQAERLLEALDAAAHEGRGAAELDGAMIDEASRKLAEAILARSGRARG